MSLGQKAFQLSYICLLSTIVLRYSAARVPGPFGGIDVWMAVLTVGLALLGVLLKLRLIVSRVLAIALATTVVLAVWAVIVHMIYGELAMKMPRVGSMVVGAGLLFVVYTTVDTVKRIRLVMMAYIFSVTVSAIVGIGIAMGYETIFDFWIAFNAPSTEMINSVISGRTAGLSGTVITFSYALCVAIPFTLALILSHKSSQYSGFSKSRILQLIAIVILCNSLMLSGTRSAILGVICAAVLILIIEKPRKFVLRFLKGLTLFVLIMGTMILLSERNEVSKVSQRITNFSDLSASVKLPMFRAAIKYGLDHPLGTGSYNLNSRYMDKDLSTQQIEHILSHTPHNQFLVIFVYYGFPGLFLLVIFYFIVVYSLYQTRRVGIRDSDSESLVLVAAISGAVFAYVINSLAHNAGPFVGDWPHFVLIGLVFSIRRVVSLRARSHRAVADAPAADLSPTATPRATADGQGLSLPAEAPAG